MSKNKAAFEEDQKEFFYCNFSAEDVEEVLQGRTIVGTAPDGIALDNGNYVEFFFGGGLCTKFALEFGDYQNSTITEVRSEKEYTPWDASLRITAWSDKIRVLSLVICLGEDDGYFGDNDDEIPHGLEMGVFYD